MDNADGKIIIKTVVDSTNFEKDISKIKNTLKKEKIESDVNLKIKSDEEDLKFWKKRLQTLQEDLEKKPNETSGYVTLHEKSIKEAEKTIESIENRIKERQKVEEAEIETLKKQNELFQEQNILTKKINENKNLKDIENVENVENVGKSFKSILAMIGKMGVKLAGFAIIFSTLAAGAGIFGIALKQAFETDQIKANLDYIKFALTKAIEPVANRIAEIVAKIIQLLYVALQYVAYIIKAWTGVNIFENAGIDAYAKSLKQAGKNAKELKKQLAGFDEMNILQDNSSSNAGTSGGAMPNFDLSSMEDVKIPKWIQWIADNRDLVIGAILAIAAAFVTLQLGFGGVVALIVAAIVALVALIISNWDKIKEVLGKVGSWIYDNIIKPVVDYFVGLWERIKQIFGPVVQFFANIFTTVWGNIYTFISNIIQIVGFVWSKIIGILSPIATWIYNNIIKPVINFFTTAWNFIIDKINKILGLARDIGVKIGDVIGGAFKKVVNAVLGAIENILNKPINALNGLIDTINNIPGLNLGRLQTFKLPRLAKGGILNMPGRGVDYYGANIAERGREAVLPLTDSQQMDLLGESIARHMVVNLTNINQLNGRIISRELQRVQNNQDFAFNR